MSLSPPASDIESKMESAIQFIKGFNGVVIAFSAGVDSSLVAALAHRALGDRAVAVTAVSESLAPGELEVAEKTAKNIGIKHFRIETNEVQLPSYTLNPSNRCYYCKNTLYTGLRHFADNSRLEAILDGTQVDDFGDDRPGLVAAKEAGVKSPLVEAGFSKVEVREAARILGLEVWDKPAMPCLSSRIPHGDEITVEKLAQVGEAESIVKRLSGLRDLRVRHRGPIASIEVPPEETDFIKPRTLRQIEEELSRIGFASVTLGPLRRPNNSKGVIGSGNELPLLD